MNRLLILPLLAATLACPGDKRRPAADTLATQPPPADTTPTDLSTLETSLPPAAPDTFTPRTPPRRRTASAAGAVEMPDAPPPLMEAVQREQAFSRFCYQEFGQKNDPTLAGAVAMVVTVAASGVTEARVEDAEWSSTAGRAVNQCLNQKAKQAWKLAPGAVRPGRYVVQLSFRGG